jgi:hypothetical protein
LINAALREMAAMRILVDLVERVQPRVQGRSASRHRARFSGVVGAGRAGQARSQRRTRSMIVASSACGVVASARVRTAPSHGREI